MGLFLYDGSLHRSVNSHKEFSSYMWKGSTHTFVWEYSSLHTSAVLFTHLPYENKKQKNRYTFFFSAFFNSEWRRVLNLVLRIKQTNHTKIFLRWCSVREVLKMKTIILVYDALSFWLYFNSHSFTDRVVLNPEIFLRTGIPSQYLHEGMCFQPLPFSVTYILDDVLFSV